jgi:hypothetical protein
VTSGVTDWVPESVFAPVHPPEAVQDVAFIEDHCRVDELPAAILVGLAESVTPGRLVPTVTVTLFTVVPPVPVHESV